MHKIFSYTSIVWLSLILTFVEAGNNVELSCNSTGMVVTLNKTQLDEQNSLYNISFSNTNTSSCLVKHDDTNQQYNQSIWIQADYDECGIKLHEEDGVIIYNQTIVVTYANTNLTYAVTCKMTNNVTVPIVGNSISVTVNENRYIVDPFETSFNIQLMRMTSNDYQVEDTSGTTHLGNTIFFKLDLTTVRDDLKLSPQNCYATDGVNEEKKYYLIKDRCPNANDGSVKTSSVIPSTKIFLWENQSFRFIGQSSAVHFACDVLICTTSNESDSCKRCGETSRKRRNVASTSKDIQIVEGVTQKVSLDVQHNLVD